MPTENRSSKNEMVSVQATIEALEEAYAGDGALDFMNDAAQFLRQFQAQPADHSEHSLDMVSERHQGEPVALPEREHYTKYLPGVIPSNAAEVNARKDGWNACLDEIVKLGPLYAHADPNDVDRLVAANTEFSRRHLAQLDENQRLRAQLAERDALADELARIEINGSKPCADIPDDHDEFLDANASAALWLLLNVSRIHAALSSNAEPEAKS